MYEAIRNLIDSNEFSVVESFEIPGRPARYAKVPRFLYDSKVGSYLDEEFENGLWKHQAEALEELGEGRNVVISTSTASGKSLIFRALALHRVMLDPQSRVVVFYPQRALVEDQLRGWRAMARVLGVDETIIGRIDGSVRPMSEREEILRKARIVIMTPDVCQAWLMSRLSLPVVKDFVGSLSTLVMDEAHTLEGVFGSNFSFLVRRLMAARDHIMGNQDNSSQIQLIAATATIAKPGEHLRRLTGGDFVVIDHTDDGAQQSERLVAHIACPPGDELNIARQLQQAVLTRGREGGFITFMDSRKGVEALAMATEGDIQGLFDDAAVRPYRAGYDAEERRRIERELRSGVLRGVVSTSALELGIDFPTLSIGFNLGVPPTRKAYRQRLGRVGRNGPGAFIIIGPPNEFRQYGTSLQEYHDMSVEPSYLYLNNRFMQFAHGRCLAIEREALVASSRLPTGVQWPDGFGDHYLAARPGGNRPAEFDAIAELGGDTPHLGYPLRNIGEQNFQIKLNENSAPIGDANQSQALRECYPGAAYYHNMRPYYVAAWHTRTFQQPFVRVRNGVPGRFTRPRIRTWLNSTITASDVLDGHLIRGEHGFLAECQMMITERVEGYTDRSGEFHSYQELQQSNPNLRARSRNFRTSGVILCIDLDWFRPLTVKGQFADALRDIFIHHCSIGPQDIGSAATNISVLDGDGRQWRRGCVAIFDETYGSLRFTEQLYDGFNSVLDRLLSAVTTDPSSESDVLREAVARVRDQVAGFVSTSPFSIQSGEIPGGYEQVFSPGSRVCYRESGAMSEDVTIIEPTIIDGPLMYRVEVQQPRGPALRRYIPASSVEPSADADSWEYSWWNRETQTYEDPPDTDETDS